MPKYTQMIQLAEFSLLRILSAPEHRWVPMKSKGIPLENDPIFPWLFSLVTRENFPSTASIFPSSKTLLGKISLIPKTKKNIATQPCDHYEINTTWRRWVRKFGKLLINTPALKLSQNTPKLHQNTSKMFPGHPRTETIFCFRFFRSQNRTWGLRPHPWRPGDPPLKESSNRDL